MMHIMLDNETRRFFVREASALAPVLYPLYDDADAMAQKTLPFDSHQHPHLFGQFRRAALRQMTEVAGVLPAGWKLGGNSRRSGQIIFTHRKGRASLRLLSENRSNVNGVPHAGGNRARQEVWAGRDRFEQTVLLPNRDLLLLVSTGRDVPSMRIVRTVTVGKFTGHAQCDFELKLLRDSSEYGFERFDGSDESEDLFDVYLEGDQDV